MERRIRFHLAVPRLSGAFLQQKAISRRGWVKSVLGDRVLRELKRQAAEDCLLCTFDAWDSEEEWD